MKYFLLVLIFAFVGCAQLMQGQAQPVKQIGRDDLYSKPVVAWLKQWALVMTKQKQHVQVVILSLKNFVIAQAFTVN
jgi:hypothetical protein